MTRSRLLVLPALALLASPLLTLPSSASTAGAPVFRQYHGPAAPLDVRGNASGADDAGEPTLGFNPKTGNVLFMANKNTYRVHGFDATRNDKATWDDVTDPVEGAQTSDPILYRDPTTNRTFVNQLELQGGSLQAYTDDDGKTYTHSTMGGSIGVAFDHQSVVTGKPVLEGGTYPKPVGYPNYVYYCTNDLYAANCAISIDGGLNFLVANLVYQGSLTGGPCAALFGHIKTDPRDGTVYLPPNGCNGKQMLFVSRDNTFSWTGYAVPNSTDGDSGHPAVDVGRQDGAVYYAWGSKDGDHGTGRIHVAMSPDKGKTWLNQSALGADLGVVTSRFPVVAAGDKGRAAVTFIGAKAEGDPNAAPSATSPNIKPYPGVWDLYVSYTTDYGKTWKTYDATPKDPVQRGPVCTAGTTCLAGRNLLDFNDMVIDDQGHVVIAYADGSPTGKEDYTKGLAKATILRQVSGPSLYAR
ncbi:MAG: hypothetical protein JWP11_1075 [Frankiales bacterium]|nr:hypothetical protein [Frankiales bacterium]